MYSTNKIIRTISLIGACALAVTTARAVIPAPDGGYPNQNTAEGDSALFTLTTGSFNTAIGFDALYNTTVSIANTATGNASLFSNTTGGFNTANGSQALYNNTTGEENVVVGA